jgi:hypothetical protein
MDGIEAIGTPSVLPLIEAARAPRTLSGDSRPAARTQNEIQDAGGEISSAARSDEQKQQAAKDFESVLLTKLFDQVQESIGGWGGLDEEDGAASQVHGLFWLYLARDVADKGGLGLWKDIYQHLTQMEGTAGAGELMNEEF